uniref:Chromosome 20 open reading frame 96 n=1 Tax=Propithecus coquereli TaxID=379532 RepID=A0A2K6EHE6_PROCO
MARVSQKPNHSGIHSTVPKFQVLDYVPWQWSRQKTKPSTLPPVQQAGSHSKSKMKTLNEVQPALHSKPTMLVASQLKNPREQLHRREKLDARKMQAKIRLMKAMLRNKRTSLQELRSHEHFLTKLNRELIKTIQDMEDSTTLNVRAMLQQQDMLAAVVDILECSNKKRLQQLESELQEWEEKEQCKINCLEQQVEQLNAKIKQTHEEVNFLSTYMDHEYSVKSVQIASLVRQLQQVKDSQQDELDDLSEMRKSVLKSLSDKVQNKRIKILRSLVVKTQSPHQEALLQRAQASQAMLKIVSKYREFIDQFEEEVPILRAEVEELQAQVWEPREIVFEDVLLRRPKCTPDMDVILNIPVEELLPF